MFKKEGYLISNNADNDLLYTTFQHHLVGTQRILVKGGDYLKITALVLFHNIPLSCVQKHKKEKTLYRSSNGLHILNQEKNAQEYESNSILVETEFPPELTVTLNNKKLTQIFIRGWMVGLIEEKEEYLDNNYKKTKFWEINDIDEVSRFEKMILTDVDGIFEERFFSALYSFTIKLPYSFESRTNPTHNFNQKNRETYLLAMQKMISNNRGKMIENEDMINNAINLLSKNNKKKYHNIVQIIQKEKHDLGMDLWD